MILGKSHTSSCLNFPISNMETTGVKPMALGYVANSELLGPKGHEFNLLPLCPMHPSAFGCIYASPYVVVMMCYTVVVHHYDQVSLHVTGSYFGDS